MCDKSQFSNAYWSFLCTKLELVLCMLLINETPGAGVILEIMCSDRKGDLCDALIPYCLVYLKTDFFFQLVNLFCDDL